MACMATESAALQRMEIGEGASMYSPGAIRDAAWRARYASALGRADRLVLASAVDMLLYALQQGHGVEYVRRIRRALKQSGPAR